MAHPHDMTDEEFLAQGVPDFESTPAESAGAAPAEPDGESEDTRESDVVATGIAEADKADAELDEPAPDLKATDDLQAAEAPPEVEKTPAEAAKDAPAAVDYKAEYERLLAPFKANGKDIAVNTVDDAISLMQMGANYNKKMAALKPSLKMMKLLENSGLLSEEKIGYLIDLEKKNPAAINKLIKDSGLDPMDLDAAKAGDYRPTSYTVDDKEMELDSVLDEIQDTPSYSRTLDIVSTKWDGPSKQVIAGSPQLLKVINGHVASGIYDTISAAVERERLFGRLNGLSDIEAYRQVGDAIEARGGFNPAVATAAATVPKALVAPPKPSQAEDDRLKEKRRAAGSTKPAGFGSVAKEFNPLSMSDEEFSKSVNQKYL